MPYYREIGQLVSVLLSILFVICHFSIMLIIQN